MVMKAEGFLADDNTFFANEELCEAYEARQALTNALTQLRIKDPDTALALINQCSSQILRYLQALEALPQTETPEGEEDHGTFEVDVLTGEPADDDNFSEDDDGESEEDTEALQSLPPGVSQPMPNLGRHIQPTPIRHQRSVNGPRSGKPDARDIRSGKGVAVKPRRRPAEPRGGNR